jgi:hypothetical protein
MSYWDLPEENLNPPWVDDEDIMEDEEEESDDEL